MAEKHYFEQYNFTKEYLWGYLNKYIEKISEKNILEVGCAEGGFIKFMIEKGITIQGIELEQSRVDISKEKAPELNISQGDITDPMLPDKLGKKFDVIIMRDVIEHVPDRVSAFQNFRALLNDGGVIFITFPPRFSGFAGHQQNGKSILQYFLYLHLLPNFAINSLGKIFGEKEKVIYNAILNFKIGLSINNFENLCNEYNFSFVNSDLFLFRPIYKIRFGIPTLKFPNIPIIRETFAFGCECLLKKN